jgi:hypothetical protein
MGELDARGLERPLDSVEIVDRGNAPAFLKVPYCALAEVGARAERRLRPIEKASGGAGLSWRELHGNSSITNDIRSPLFTSRNTFAANVFRLDMAPKR